MTSQPQNSLEVVDTSIGSSGGSDYSPMEGYEMPERIKKFYSVNNVDQFQYDRPFYKGQKDKDNEFKVI